MAVIICGGIFRLASLEAMPASHERLACALGGAGVGAVVRQLVLGWFSGPVLPLLAFGAMTVVAGFVIGLALGSPDGRARAFGLGLGTGVASLSLYAVLGVTHRIVASVTFLISVPVLTAIAVTLGIVVVGTRARVSDGAPG